MKTITLEDAAWSRILEAVQRHSDEGPPNSGLQSVELEAARKGLETALEDQLALEASDGISITNPSEEVDSLIAKIRELAGKIGMLETPEVPGMPDSKEYCFQVRCGLSDAVVEILEGDIGAMIQFLRYCICGFVDPDEPRISELLEALEEEIYQQMGFEEDKGDQA